MITIYFYTFTHYDVDTRVDGSSKIKFVAGFMMIKSVTSGVDARFSKGGSNSTNHASGHAGNTDIGGQMQLEG